ncbi:MAG: hypothetical protein J6S67_19865 [Methanobrevibacter sp.]|nr:hypothetical protein [Methanobrevibacter sp.]
MLDPHNKLNKKLPARIIEDTRARLIGQSKSSQKGRQRYDRRVKSSVANTVKQYNSIDMNKLFKEDILTVNINVNGETNDYIVRISFGGFSDLIQDEIKRGGGKLDLRAIIRALVKGFNQEDVYVWCACDDFRYRFHAWATKNDYNSGVPEFRPAKITNPDNSLGSSCKHVLLVLNNNAWIIKVASVINNYIKYMEKNYQKLYADIIYPAVYGKKYTGAVQTGIFDDEEEIATEKDTEKIDKAIEYGKKSTQFQKGNEKGFRFVSDKDRQQQSIEDVEEEQ